MCFFFYKYNVYLKIRFDVFGDVSFRVSAAIQRSRTCGESASPQPDILEFAADSDVSVVVKHKIKFVLGKYNGQSLIYYLFHSK